MRLRPATSADFAFIRAVAGSAEAAPFLTDEDEAGLAAHAAAPDSELLIAETADGPEGFALFCGIGAPGGVVELRRLGLHHPGGGRGREFLRLLVGHAFADPRTTRLWLDASAENPRALHLYRTTGFTDEALLRAHWFRPSLGRTVDMVILGMMRNEWQG